VLSSNDGCVIARSNEVKAMGVKMGQPYFQVKEIFAQKGIVVCSGNLEMYKEISDKVMEALGRYTDATEKYSIDEAFLKLPRIATENLMEYVATIRNTIDRLIGIPISIGIAVTKTLAKLASEKAKKTEAGILAITEENLKETLKATEIADIWGIGPKATEKLKRYGVVTASDFLAKDLVWVEKN
jgi:DNA polymerase V